MACRCGRKRISFLIVSKSRQDQRACRSSERKGDKAARTLFSDNDGGDDEESDDGDEDDVEGRRELMDTR